ncbi:hypothetical protein CCACVL1_29367, partial [Corchorus capsularis]
VEGVENGQVAGVVSRLVEEERRQEGVERRLVVAVGNRLVEVEMKIQLLVEVNDSVQQEN